MAGPVYANNGGIGGTNVAPYTPGLPASVANGDLLVLQVEIGLSSGTMPVPSGWTQLLNQFNGTRDQTYAVFYQVYAGAGAPTITTGSSITAIISRYTGANTTSPIGAVGTFASGASSTVTSTGFTSTANNSLAVLSVQVPATSANYTTPTSWSGAFDLFDSGRDSEQAIVTQAIASSGTASGSTSSLDSGYFGNPFSWYSIQFEILASPPGIGGVFPFDSYPDVKTKGSIRTSQYSGEQGIAPPAPSAAAIQSFDSYPESRVKRPPLSRQFAGEFSPQGSAPYFNGALDHYPETRVKRFPKTSQFDGERGMAQVPSAPWVQSFDEFPSQLWLKRIKLTLHPSGEPAFYATTIPPTAPLNYDSYSESRVKRPPLSQQFAGEFAPQGSAPYFNGALDHYPETRVKRFPKTSQFDGERGMAQVPSAPWVQSFDEFPSQLWLKRIKLTLHPSGEPAFYATTIPPTAPLNYDSYQETRVKRLALSYRFAGEFAPRGNVPSAPWVQNFDEFPSQLWLKRIKSPLQPDGEPAFIQTFVPPTPPLAFDTTDAARKLRRVAQDYVEFVTYTITAQAPVDFWEAGRRRRARAEGFSEFSLVSSFPNPVEQFESKLLRRKQRSDGFVSDAQFVTKPVTVSPDEFSGVLRRRRPLLVAARDVPTVLIPPPPPPIGGGLDLSSTLRKKYMSVVMSSAGFDVYQYFVFIQMWSQDGLAYLLKLEDK